jgi:hypothetical protein
MSEFVRYDKTLAAHAKSCGPDYWKYRSADCPKCQDVTIKIARFRWDAELGGTMVKCTKKQIRQLKTALRWQLPAV